MATKYNIRVQYAVWVAVVVLGTVVSLTSVHLWRGIEQQEAAVRWLARHEARSLARVIGPSVASTNINTLLSLIEQSVHDEEVRYLRVLDSHDNVLYRPPSNEEPSRVVLVSEPIEVMDKKVGAVELGLGRRRMGQLLWATLLWDLGIGMVLLAVFVAGSFLISGPVQAGVSSLADYVRRVAKGEARGEKLESDLAEVDLAAQELTALMERVDEARRWLDRAQKEMKATQKEMDEYTYVISHDLKEPLRGMEAFSKFLAEGYRDKLDEEGRRHIDIIRKSVLRMQRLINDLLHFSRLSQQRQPMHPVGMNTMLMHVRVRLQHALDAKNVDLRVNKLPTIVCDETAMTEVFHNLISNAIKYNDKPHPVIEIGCTEKTNPETQQPEYEFFVRDNGMGIKKEYFDKIFQIFQRLQRDEEGTGIGLTIVRRVIEWHGGRIWLESEEGKGTTFYFTIPKRDIAKTGTVVEMTGATMKGTGSIAPTV